VIKSIYFLPHGGTIIPGLEPNYNEESEKLHKNMEKIAQEMREDDIKVIFLTSPHGYSHVRDFLVYYHNVFEGFHIYRGNESELKVDQFLWPGNTQIAEILFQVMQQAQLPVSPFLQADPNYNLKLSWGETIPLSYIANQDGPAVVIFSVPMLIGESDQTKDQLFKMGEILSIISESQTFTDIPISIVISGDLAHKHDKDHEYGYSEKSKTFDELSIKWAKDPTNDKFEELLELHQSAASCGIYGIGIIQGIINNNNSEWVCEHSVYALPSYFGMMISSWKPKDEK
jgi:aromatic ring-opening dioxygenase LigB subunit